MKPNAEIIIVGAGPAGSCAAIQLAQRGLAESTLLVDRACFPRHKLCGGGVVRQADRLLDILGVYPDVPAVPIHTTRFEYPGGVSVRQAPGMFRVVRREEFDHALLREAERRGVTVLQGESIGALERISGGIAVHGRETRTARIVIGADGANSRVRRAFVGGQAPRFVALEVLTPMDEGKRGGVSDADANTAVFDFRGAEQGLRGYRWDFPSVRAGEPLMNRGIGGSAWTGSGSLAQLFARELDGQGVTMRRDELQGATAPLYHPAIPQSAPHVLLAGDAVGIDPWFGEGISTAVGTGILAANAAAEALQSGDFTFRDHHRRIRDSAVGWELRRNRATARTFYRAAPRPFGLMPWLGLSEVAG